jgi:flagellar biosynthesis protein FliP
MNEWSATKLFFKETSVCIVHIIKYLSNSFEQTPPCEAKDCSSAQDIPQPSCKSKVHYCIYNNLLLLTVLTLMSLILTLQTHFFKIHFNVIHPHTP